MSIGVGNTLRGVAAVAKPWRALTPWAFRGGGGGGLLRDIRKHGLDKPSRLQKHAIKPIAALRNTLVAAPSGTGKTTVYAIGLLEWLNPIVMHIQHHIHTPH